VHTSASASAGVWRRHASEGANGGRGAKALAQAAPCACNQTCSWQNGCVVSRRCVQCVSSPTSVVCRGLRPSERARGAADGGWRHMSVSVAERGPRWWHNLQRLARSVEKIKHAVRAGACQVTACRCGRRGRDSTALKHGGGARGRAGACLHGARTPTKAAVFQGPQDKTMEPSP
jgi:hypothetical protein